MRASSESVLLRSSTFSIACLGLAGVFAAIAYWIYGIAGKPSDFLPKLTEYALQISVIALAGAAVKEFVGWRDNARTRHNRQDELRGEFLRRLRETHVQVIRSRYLMRVHNSARTWSEQSRSLIERIPELEEISEDLQASPRELFDRQDDIVAGIREIISYLGGCRDEYAARHSDVGSNGRQGKPLEDIIGASHMPWTKDFFYGKGSFKSQYETNFLKSKLPMQEAVFSPMAPNKGLELTAYSVRYAPASGRS